MPEAKRTKAVAARPAESTPVDPRLALAQQYLKSASIDVAEKEVAQSHSRRSAGGRSRSGPRAFSLSITPATFVHVLLGIAVLTFAAILVLGCYHLMLIGFLAGRVTALPAGVIVAASLSYLSAIYLAIIESTANGRTEVDSLPGDWRDWFWTLPSTLGMLAVAAFVGWFLSLGIPINVWFLVALCALLLYPMLQLSALETGSPLTPLSLPVLQSLARHPYGWFIFYAVSFAVANVLWAIGRLAWTDPPYATVLIMGPLISVSLFFYSWLLGQLAYLIGAASDKDAAEEES